MGAHTDNPTDYADDQDGASAASRIDKEEIG